MSLRLRALWNQSPLPAVSSSTEWSPIMKLLLFCILLVLCWPLALLAVILYPIVWVLLLPFRIVGIAVDGVLDLLRGIFRLPGRLLRAI